MNFINSLPFLIKRKENNIMEESLSLIKYKWEQGTYGLWRMMLLVELEMITEQDFFEITRFKYKEVFKKNFENS